MNKLFVFFTIITLQVFSIEFSKVTLGDTYYIDNFTSFEEVVVIDKNKQKGYKVVGDDSKPRWYTSEIYSSKEKWEMRAGFASGFLGAFWEDVTK